MNLAFNKQRWKKELRPLALPWVVSVLSGGLIGLSPLVEGSGLQGLLLNLSGFGLFGGLALLAATAFGSELQERTLGFLLSQPSSRSRLWAEKMMVLGLAIISAAAAEVVLLVIISGWYSGDEIPQALRELLGQHSLVVGGMFLLATACSCAFWTLLAGSTIGGAVFTVTAQFGVVLALSFVIWRVRGQDQLFQDATAFPAIVLGALLYSPLFLYLGWKKFVLLEVRGTVPGEAGDAGPNWKVPWSRLLASRPTGRVRNLVLKEIWLQRPMFRIAAVFTLFWAATLLLQWLRPRQDITYVFDTLTCVYAPITALLAGCISLGEEKALRTIAPQLVLPFSPWLQWLIKLAVCAGVAILLSLALPLLLFWITGGIMNLRGSALMNQNDHGLQALALISGLIFLLGFWAISLTTNTVRAALLAIAAIIILPALVETGAYYGSVGGPGRGARMAPLLQDTAAATIVVALGQSLLQFRRSEEGKSKLAFYGLILAGTVIFVSLWTTCVG